MVVRVAAVQHDVVWEDRDATLRRLTPRVAAASRRGARLVVLPEMFAVGFSLRTDRIAEPVDGPTASWLAEQASAHGIWIAGSVPETSPGADRPANVFVLAGPDGEQHRYAKRHPFSYGGEADRFERGDTTLTVAVDGLRISPVICYDLRFGNQLWAQARETDAYLVVASWPAVRHAHWRTLLLARAIENQAYVVGVNHIGTGGDGIAHAGGSMVVGPFGDVVADAGDGDVTIVADLDPDEVASVRQRFPFLEDRR